MRLQSEVKLRKVRTKVRKESEGLWLEPRLAFPSHLRVMSGIQLMEHPLLMLCREVSCTRAYWEHVPSNMEGGR